MTCSLLLLQSRNVVGSKPYLFLYFKKYWGCYCTPVPPVPTTLMKPLERVPKLFFLLKVSPDGSVMLHKMISILPSISEEWAKRRPNLANLSIWTLVSYARKFDTMKKQLISTHNQVNRVGDRRRKDFVEDIGKSNN